MVSEMSALSSQILRAVDASEVVHYLVSHGWQTIQGKRPNISILRKDAREIILPLTSDYADYEDRLQDALQIAALIEEIPLQQIVESILNPASDIMRFRLDDQDSDGGTVPLLEGLNLLEGIRKGLAAIACSIVSPQAFHPRLHRTEAELFLKGCKLGQTARGSFVAQVLCPIEPLPFEDAQLQLFNGSESFGRMVTSQYIGVLRDLVFAIDGNQLEKLVEPGSCLSANFCESLVEMQASGASSTLTVDVVWNKNIPLPKGVPGSVKIKKRHFDGIQRVGVSLRKPQIELSKQIFGGYVDQLKGEPNSEGRMSGETILAVLSSDEGSFRARVSLTPDDYMKACDAHKNSQLIVIRGVLKRGTRLNEIADYDMFVPAKFADE